MTPQQALQILLQALVTKPGLTIEEIADVLEISPETAKRDWRMAKSWLFDALTRDSAT